MTERNPCHELSCPAICCHNVIGSWATSEQYFLKDFPGATKLEKEEQLGEKVKNLESGVYYVVDRSWIYFSISGSCPNLDESNSCTIHESRSYPAMCRNMVPDSNTCKKAIEIFHNNLSLLSKLSTEAETNEVSGR
jgi:hypothetical protein